MKFSELSTTAKCKLTKAIVTAESMMLMANNALVANASGTKITIDDAANLDTSIGKIFEFLCTIIRYVGVGMFIYGLYMLYTSFKDDRPDDKLKAIAVCIGGLGAITIKTLIGPNGFGLVVW